MPLPAKWASSACSASPSSAAHSNRLTQTRSTAAGWSLSRLARLPPGAGIGRAAGFSQEIKKDIHLDHTEQQFVRLTNTRLGLVYYPLWVLRYLYRGRSFQVVVDGFNGEVLYGKAPGSVGLPRRGAHRRDGAWLGTDRRCAGADALRRLGGDGNDFPIVIALGAAGSRGGDDDRRLPHLPPAASIRNSSATKPSRSNKAVEGMLAWKKNKTSTCRMKSIEDAVRAPWRDSNEPETGRPHPAPVCQMPGPHPGARR